MQWMPLKLDLLPAVTIQTDKTLQLYQRIVKQINGGDTRQLPKLKQLQNQIKRRIGQLDQFYDHHCFDQRVALFHRLKLQLMSVIARELVVGEERGKEEEGFGRRMMIMGAEGSSSRLEVGRADKVVREKIKVGTVANSKMQSQKSLAVGKKPTQTPVKQPQKKPTQHPPPKQTPTHSKRPHQLQPLTLHTQPSPPPSKLKAPSNLQQQIDSIVAMPPPQIVFTIKMTKQQYLQFLSAKQSKR